LVESQLFTVLLVLVLLYLVEHIACGIGVLRASRREYDEENASAVGALGEQPRVTVLVCARDEERNIESCVRSLMAIRYPADKLELLIVDDKSTDDTPQILRNWQARIPNLKVLRTGPEIAHLRGKVNALTQGMDAATGEIVMITDADSHVPPEWVEEYLRYYRDDIGMVASITLLDSPNFFAGLQSIDWGYLLGISAACSNLKIPLSVIGNNMTVRKAAYESVGGYREIPFSVTEDFALFKAIWHKKPWKIRYKISPELLVMSEATPDLPTWWRQKHRWVKGGQGLKAIGWVIFILGLFGNGSMIVAPFFLPLWPALAIIAIKWLADLLIIFPVLAATRKLELLKYFPIYELYLFLFVFSMPVMILQRNVKWKGRVYKH
jgi:1,2-diacylglycerol 3-beta-glucosyltransferase